MTPTDFMRIALDEARKGIGAVSPNPAVGAVVVRDGTVVGRGHHVYRDVKHAEVVALEQAGEAARGSTVYVSLEPCCHTGRTGPCTRALVEAGVAQVVAAMRDPNPLVAGKGMDELRAAGIQVQIDTQFTAEAELINEEFAHFMRTGRPLVILKAAVTLDGKISAPVDNQGWITSELARAHVQQLRHRADSICTGIGTVLSDDCMLTDRTTLPRSRTLLRIVLDSQLRIPLHSRMVETFNGDVLVVTTSMAPPERRRALEARGIRVLAADHPGGRTDLRQVVDWLSKERYLSLMIEAGSKVNWAALESGVADKIFFYYAPKILGGTKSLPVAGGAGRLSRADAIQLRDVRLHAITAQEFAVEAWLDKH